MSIITPEIEFVDRSTESLRYIEHGWPSDLCRWHSHEELELHLIVETSGKTFVGDYIGAFSSGSLFLVGSHLPHNWITDDFGGRGCVDVRDMLVQFHSESITEIKSAFPEFRALDALIQRSAYGIEFIKFNPQVARGRFRGIRDSSGGERVLRLLSFLLELAQHPHQKGLSVARVAHPNFSSKQANISRVIDHIVAHYPEDISLEQAAAMSNMSMTAFARNFQKLTGSRFTEFVTRVRIGQACSMLQATDEKVATICHEVGFRNLANFNRHFLRIKDTTPSAYRSYTRTQLHSGSVIYDA